jgi:hypothetical protein
MADPFMSVTWRQSTRWRNLAALVPALLLLVYLPAQVMLRCRIDGLLRTECCCSHQEQQPPAGPTAKAQDCCAQEMADSQRPQADIARSASRDVSPAIALAVLAPCALVTLPPVTHFDRAAKRHGPPREGPPLILVKHAFLI